MLILRDASTCETDERTDGLTTFLFTCLSGFRPFYYSEANDVHFSFDSVWFVNFIASNLGLV